MRELSCLAKVVPAGALRPCSTQQEVCNMLLSREVAARSTGKCVIMHICACQHPQLIALTLQAGTPNPCAANSPTHYQRSPHH